MLISFDPNDMIVKTTTFMFIKRKYHDQHKIAINFFSFFYIFSKNEMNKEIKTLNS